MQNLNLYAKIEDFLDFSEINKLYNIFYKEIDKLDKNSLVDIGCGNGKFLSKINLNNKVGIDISSYQIEKAKKLNLDVRCVDICKLNSSFDIATAVFDVINYIPKEQLKDFFKCVHDRLNSDGVFLFDINSFDGFNEVADGSLIVEKEDNFLAIDAQFDNNILKTKITYFYKNNSFYQKEQDEILQYYYKNSFLTNLLKGIGFKVDIKKIYLYLDDFCDKYLFIAKKI